MVTTRRPSGRVPWPLVLVEGDEKSGCTWSWAELSGSGRVGRTFVFDLDVLGAADQYAELGDFELVTPADDTCAALVAAIGEAAAEPPFEGRPNVIVADPVSVVWERLRGWVDWRARNAKDNRRRLANDPHASIEIGKSLWEDATNRWLEVLGALRRHRGISIVVARGHEEVRYSPSGDPLADVGWRVDAQRQLTRSVHAWVRFRRPHIATLIAAQAPGVDIAFQGLPLPDSNPLEYLLFDLLRVDLATAGDPGAGPDGARPPSGPSSTESVQTDPAEEAA